MKASIRFQLVSGLIAALQMPAAYSQIFVSSYYSGTVGAYTSTGAPLNPTLISGLSGPTALAMDQGTNLFISINNIPKVAEYTSSGALVNASLISGFTCTGLAADGQGFLYVVDFPNQRIQKYTVSGVLINDSLVTGLTEPQGIALDGRGNLYVANWATSSSGGWGTIGKYTTSGVTVNAALISQGLGNPIGLAVDPQGYLYVANANLNVGCGAVAKFTLDGASVNPFLVPRTPSGGASGVAVDQNGHLFVISRFGMGEYSTNGSVVNATLVTNLNNPYGIAIVPPDPRPTIIGQPRSMVVHAFDNLTFTVTAAGALPLSYQWYLNGFAIAGTSSNLNISNVSQADLGIYNVRVTNVYGAVTSSNAVLSMYPYLAVPFRGAVTYLGRPATFSVQAWGTGPLSFQWFKDGSSIQNATNQNLTFASMQFTNAGMYWVVVSSALGSVTNVPAQVVVNASGISLGLYPGVTIDGAPGYNYIVQRTADLTDTNAWQTMTNITLTQPVQLWIDTSVDASLPANPFRFYRVLTGP